MLDQQESKGIKVCEGVLHTVKCMGEVSARQSSTMRRAAQ